MPINYERRQSDLTQALRLMVEAQGDEPLNGMTFSPSDTRFQALIPTTWRELLDDGLIEDRGEKPGPSFRLTARGWLAGLQLTGALERQDIRDWAIGMRRALKARVQGRLEHYDARVDVREFAREIDLPIGWVSNAMRANLLQEVFKNHLMNASLDKLLIRIPPTFDMERLT